MLSSIRKIGVIRTQKSNTSIFNQKWDNSPLYSNGKVMHSLSMYDRRTQKRDRKRNRKKLSLTNVNSKSSLVKITDNLENISTAVEAISFEEVDSKLSDNLDDISTTEENDNLEHISTAIENIPVEDNNVIANLIRRVIEAITHKQINELLMPVLKIATSNQHTSIDTTNNDNGTTAASVANNTDITVKTILNAFNLNLNNSNNINMVEYKNNGKLERINGNVDEQQNTTAVTRPNCITKSNDDEYNNTNIVENANVRNCYDDDDQNNNNKLKSMLLYDKMNDNNLSDDGRMISANASKLAIDNNKELNNKNYNWHIGSISNVCEQKIRFAKNIQHTYITNEPIINNTMTPSSSIKSTETKRKQLKITIPSILSLKTDSTAVSTSVQTDEVNCPMKTSALNSSLLIDQTSETIMLNGNNYNAKNFSENEKKFADMKRAVIKQKERFNRKQKRIALYTNENFESKPWELISRISDDIIEELTNDILLSADEIIDSNTEKYVQDFLETEFINKFPKQKMQSICKI